MIIMKIIAHKKVLGNGAAYLFCNVLRLVLNSLEGFSSVKLLPIVSQLAIISYTRPSFINSFLVTWLVNILKTHLSLILTLIWFSFKSQINLSNWIKNCMGNCSMVIFLSTALEIPRILLSQIEKCKILCWISGNFGAFAMST